jgi:hypothetical protein
MACVPPGRLQYVNVITLRSNIGLVSTPTVRPCRSNCLLIFSGGRGVLYSEGLALLAQRTRICIVYC